MTCGLFQMDIQRVFKRGLGLSGRMLANCVNAGFVPMEFTWPPGMMSMPSDCESISPKTITEGREIRPAATFALFKQRRMSQPLRHALSDAFLIPSQLTNNQATNKSMKTIQRSLLISLVPLLTPLTAFAETVKQADRASTIPATKATAASWRASQVMGLNVKNSTDETLGEVEDLVLNMKTGEILAVIISSGGFLGIADTLSAVPVSALRYDGTAKAFKTRLTKEQLSKAPQFKTDAWPDYNEATSTEALRSYRDSIDVTDQDNSSRNQTKSDNNARRVTEPDNTTQNKKEKNKNDNVPTDQGNSAKDIQITKDIRSAIMDKDLSFNAKNIKIITRNQRVHLKGVVESDAEHQAILTIARNHADAANITDDLKVNPK
jgi:osmotically-inducible protein OsmY/sporulation protein YlmC with PRC-barrel domain